VLREKVQALGVATEEPLWEGFRRMRRARRVRLGGALRCKPGIDEKRRLASQMLRLGNRKWEATAFPEFSEIEQTDAAWANLKPDSANGKTAARFNHRETILWAF
jgi:hypothetical protein